MKKYKASSMNSKLILSAIIIAVATISIFLVAIFSSKLNVIIQNDAYNSFKNQTNIHSDFVSDRITFDISDIGVYAYQILDVYDDIIRQDNSFDESDVHKFFEASYPALLEAINSSYINKSYVILNEHNAENEYPAFIIYDKDPFIVDDNIGDLSVLVAPSEMDKFAKSTIGLHEDNKTSLTFDEGSIDILTKPIAIAMDNPTSRDVEKMGYWQVSVDSVITDDTIVTYSLPLLDRDGNPFGVFGISIKQEYFYDVFPPLAEDTSVFGYTIAKHNFETDELVPIITSGEYVEEGLELDVAMQFSKLDVNDELFKLENTRNGSDLIASFSNLSLYDDAYFTAHEWILVGLANKEILDESYNLFFVLLIISITLMLIVVFSLMLYVSKIIISPISLIVDKMESNDIEVILSLSKEKTGFSETDKLAYAIEQFSRNENESRLKTDRIIQMVNLPLGTFEYKKKSDFVICSTSLLLLMDIKTYNLSNGTVSKRIFDEKFYKITAKVEDEKEKIYLTSENPPKWLKIITRERSNTILGVCLDVTESVLEKHHIMFDRDHDKLTGLSNRTAFKRKLDLAFKKEIKNIAAYIVFDMDNLKYINDNYGHDTGDVYIKSVANVLLDVFGSECLLARISGDEFHIFIQGFLSKEAILALANKTYNNFENNFMVLPDGDIYKMRMSGGIAWYGEDSSKIEELARYADFAMYQGKQTTKGRIIQFDKDKYMNESYIMSGREELNKILDNEMVDYAVQPIIDAKDGSIYGYEALMRPQSEILNTPLKLIKLASVQSQLWKIERITFFKSLEFYQKNRGLFGDAKMFINSVPNEILSSEDIEMLEILHGDVLCNIVVEFTEDEQVESAVLSKKCRHLDGWNSLIALDNYGSGYNSDIAMITINPNIIKIDRMMISKIEIDSSRQAILSKLLIFAKERDIKLLAEGVETAAQMEYLIRCGVDYLQGFYISKPLATPNYNTDKIKSEIEAITGVNEVIYN